MGREKRVKSDLAGKKDDIAQRGNGEGEKRRKKGKKEKREREREKKKRVEDPDLAPSPNMLIWRIPKDMNQNLFWTSLARST